MAHKKGPQKIAGLNDIFVRLQFFALRGHPIVMMVMVYAGVMVLFD